MCGWAERANSNRGGKRTPPIVPAVPGERSLQDLVVVGDQVSLLEALVGLGNESARPLLQAQVDAALDVASVAPVVATNPKADLHEATARLKSSEANAKRLRKQLEEAN